MVPFSHSLPAIEEAITTVILYYGKLLRVSVLQQRQFTLS